jgi:predicted nucleic acid-binding protein
MKRTFADAGILIEASRGEGPLAEEAMAIVDGSDREFASSIFLKMEVMPKAIYHRNQDEVNFYEAFFSTVAYWAKPLERIVDEAYQEACISGMSALDALHVAAAALVGADELVTTEKPTKPIHRTTRVNVVSIQPI